MQNNVNATAKNFPNGFTSWHETHFEICFYLSNTQDIEGSMANTVQTQSGRGGLYELSQALTDEFEAKHKDREWDGEFFDEIDEFLLSKNRTFPNGHS